MSIYRDLGVVPIINAAGENTRLSGSLLLPEVRAAMDQAARSFVVLAELQAAAGKLIAAATGAEAGFVTAGAAAGLALAAAACIAGEDPLAIHRLPDTTGLAHEIVIEAVHRDPYDRCLRAAGARLVTAGTSATGCTREQFAAAFGPCTAAAAWFSTHEPQGLPLAEVVAVAHEHGLPVIVDASLALPPVDNLTRFIQERADLVAFSAGKALRGPQAAGFLAGRADLIRSAAMHGADMGAIPDYPRPWQESDFTPEDLGEYGLPSHGIGRSMKVGKEEIVGTVMALQAYLRRDHAAEQAYWQAQAQALAENLEGVPGVTVQIVESRGAPALTVSIDAAVAGHTPDEAFERLLGAEPRVYVSPLYLYGDAPVLGISVTTLQPGEAEIVAARVRAVLTGMEDMDRSRQR